MNDAAVYVVLGATGGIGAELCRRLVKHGSRITVAARDASRLESFANELGAMAYPLDATRFEDVEQCVAATVERYGRLDGIANCVGSLLLKSAHLTTSEEWQHVLAANLTTAFATVRSAAKVMTGGGSIALVSSVAARVGLANHEGIAAAKAGVIGLALSAAATYAPRGIRVNCVAPGLVRTPMTTRLTSNEASLKTSCAMHPLGRIGEPGEVAGVLDWLLGPEATWVTGQVIGIDGGLGTIRAR